MSSEPESLRKQRSFSLPQCRKVSHEKVKLFWGKRKEAFSFNPTHTGWKLTLVKLTPWDHSASPLQPNSCWAFWCHVNQLNTLLLVVLYLLLRGKSHHLNTNWTYAFSWHLNQTICFICLVLGYTRRPLKATVPLLHPTFVAMGSRVIYTFRGSILKFSDGGANTEPHPQCAVLCPWLIF